jgi:divalent metal cation (Fe/Co/Zn/Cd) transporter
VSVFFETIALRIAIKSIKAEMKAEEHRNFFAAIKHSKDPTTMTVLFEDSLALMGLVIATVAITLVHLTGNLTIDAIASIIIGVLLMVFALFLANETKKMLVGEAVTPRKRDQILGCLESCDEVDKVVSLKTMHLSSDEVIVAAEVNYRSDITVDELEVLNDRIEKSIKEVIPNAKVYLEAEN